MPELDAPWDVVGERVRAVRRSAGLTVRELARRIGVSASHVSQVERGIGAFSVPALYAVASELGVSMNELLDASPRPSATAAAGPESTRLQDLVVDGIVQRADAHPSIQLSSGPRWSRLTAVGEPESEFLEVVYAPGTAAPEDHIHHAGREFGIVISGQLNVEVGGAATVLQPGDSIVFDSPIPHRFWNDGDVEVRAIWFVRDGDPHDPVPHA
ncbi:cupin domain-containing protein [Microbacterium sp. ARD32]|uniref:helix-turn-helix domain-containing protein n=1 Tax=Microbacterium sp. ARD32 TaxID=2962577 RepID=UPI0028821D6C|nr:cupin domain-containing protein [Microbacterium sp. ARD32]MDT0158529.1 cupin domain-containing protein [Microbacterium sp. ARD32]